MEKGELVRIEPLSLKDKNRIREHGEVWQVERSHGGDLRPREVLCKSVSTGHLRWWEHGQVWPVR